MRILGKEPITRDNSVRFLFGRYPQNCLFIGVSSGIAPRQKDSFIGIANMLRCCIRFGIDGDGLDVEFPRSLADADLRLTSATLIDTRPSIRGVCKRRVTYSDLATIGDK
jgi:hypothetical protein